MRSFRQNSLGTMRERDVAEVMAECSHTDDGSPVIELLVGWEERLDFGVSRMTRNHVENPTREIHHAEAVLKAMMCRAGIDEVGQRQLVNAPQSLKRSRVDYSSFVRRNADECVNRIAKLVL